MCKILIVVGTRPNFIKVTQFKKVNEQLGSPFDIKIVHTGQHYDDKMADVFFRQFELTPDYFLNIPADSANTQMAEIMLRLEKVAKEFNPSLMMVVGDVNSTFAAAITANKMGLKIAHIESGLRSNDRTMPEEINRVVADHVSQYLFVPTQNAADILKNEGLKKNTYFTGDIMVDTMKNNIKIALQQSTVIQDLSLQNQQFNLLTLHRNYNVDNSDILEHILNELGDLEEKIIFPVHPRTRKMLDSSYKIPENIQLTEPLGYLDFITLEHASNRIITDSGGIQKEAYILRKPCITLRTETEWIETVEEKWNCLINPTDKLIASKIAGFKVPENQKEIFGNDVTQKMVNIINTIH